MLKLCSAPSGVSRPGWEGAEVRIRTSESGRFPGGSTEAPRMKSTVGRRRFILFEPPNLLRRFEPFSALLVAAYVITGMVAHRLFITRSPSPAVVRCWSTVYLRWLATHCACSLQTGYGHFSYFQFTQFQIEGLKSRIQIIHRIMCQTRVNPSLFSGNVCMQEFKAPGSGIIVKT